MCNHSFTGNYNLPDPVTFFPTLLGLNLVLLSFTILWTLENLRERYFSAFDLISDEDDEECEGVPRYEVSYSLPRDGGAKGSMWGKDGAELEIEGLIIHQTGIRQDDSGNNSPQ
jgi:hypothetical protein